MFWVLQAAVKVITRISPGTLGAWKEFAEQLNEIFCVAESADLGASKRNKQTKITRQKVNCCFQNFDKFGNRVSLTGLIRE